MSDRLDDLRHQRSLVHEHLAWLDREIAAAEKNAAPSLGDAKVSSPAGPAIVSNATAEKTAAVEVAADSMLEKYRVPPEALKQDVKKGCLLYFAAALALLALVVVALFFALRHD